jgi:uncharacterized membrane protein YbhN (UPF0104 family)
MAADEAAAGSAASLAGPSAQAGVPRGHIHVKRLLAWAVVIGVLSIALDLLGWDVGAWFGRLWEALTGVSPAYLFLGLALQTAQTTLFALAWLAIVRYAYPAAEIPFKPVLASYAAGVALNGFLPAHIGTFVMMFLFLSFIQGSTFPGILVGWPVQKLFFSVTGAVTYVYLFSSVPGSFHLTHKHAAAHPQLTVLLVFAGAAVVALVARQLWRKLTKLWDEAKVGATILWHPRVYLGRVVLPELIGWCAKLGVIGVFLAAYGIPASFHSVMSVAGGNSLANLASVTPGAVGITQAVSTASLSSVADPTTAAAYSLGQQLVTTTWNQLFAIGMLVWAFGWTSGKQLLRQSYANAKVEAKRRAQ